MELKLWHSKNEEPKHMEHCLISFGGEKYIDFELVFYDSSEKCFLTFPYPHPTEQKIKCHSIDNGIIEEAIYKNMRDKIKLSDIVGWCRLSDLVNIDNTRRKRNETYGKTNKGD